jgi:hypothetical protein
MKTTLSTVFRVFGSIETAIFYGDTAPAQQRLTVDVGTEQS